MLRAGHRHTNALEIFFVLVVSAVAGTFVVYSPCSW
jgi:hypothetical protein